MTEVLDGEDDRLLASDVLARDASWSSRAAAATVLANFSEHDAAWHDLITTMTDPVERVRDAAEAVLKGFMQTESTRPVRWDPARESLAALLDGTNLFTREAALGLLKIVTGEDFGADTAAWSEWLSGPPGSS